MITRTEPIKILKTGILVLSERRRSYELWIVSL